MAKAYPPVKMRVTRRVTKGAPKDLGPRGQSGPQSKTKPKAVTDTTNTVKSTRTTVSQPGTGKQDSNPRIQKQKANRTKAKMKATLKANKPGAAKAAKVAKTAAKKAAVKTAVKGGLRAASRALGPVGAIAGAAEAIGYLPKSGRTGKDSRGQMGRRKK